MIFYAWKKKMVYNYFQSLYKQYFSTNYVYLFMELLFVLLSPFHIMCIVHGYGILILGLRIIYPD